MGLAACGKDVVNSGSDDLIADLRQSYNATNRGISVRLLEERLAAPEAGDNFKRSFILYALGTLLSPTARLDVSPSFLHFLINMDVVHQYNWGKFLLDRLVREVSRFRQGNQRAVGGCRLFLHLFYYESISIEGAGSSTPIAVPCLSSWGGEISEREKRERELGGYGCGEVISKEDNHDMESLEYRIQVKGLSGGKMSTGVPIFEQERTQADEEQMNGDFSMEEVCVANFARSKGVECGDVDVIVEPNRRPCGNKEYGCSEIVDYVRKNDHEENCTFAPCACPLLNCNFIGSSEQLSLHFGNKHWDSGRRFGYDIPFPISLGMNERFLVLQAEEDGILFVLNSSVKSIGNIVTITCVAPSSSKLHFLYDIVCGKGISSLRLKSSTDNFLGRVKGFPPMDFLLIPFRFLGPSGETSLEVCIWSSAELGSDCSCSI
ncbi:E3 ubiquitin-protein ligase SINA-like 8 [Hibiscus syriacus]|uniref:E3 ubiquitin-protein ligase SINA-like 8 n=1 Tax=Hibiscus syriacus TaxID=106335 RepID=UPI001921DC46|nr:E3 ubiquitin-protein ligase SINA-like 8 [Hibiscus syriacus]